MDNLELKDELSLILGNLKAAHRSCEKHGFAIRESLGDLVWYVENQLVDVNQAIEDEKEGFTS